MPDDNCEGREKSPCKTKIACIGAGYWGTNLVRNFSNLGVLSWVCDSSHERLTQLSAEYPSANCTDSFEKILADPLGRSAAAVEDASMSHSE